MVKLTILHYKLKDEALERFHLINEHAEGLMFEWESALDKARSIGDEYIQKPYVENFEFDDDDYEVTTGHFRVREDDIQSYRENIDGLVEVTTSLGEIVTIQENIEFLDEIFCR